MELKNIICKLSISELTNIFTKRYESENRNIDSSNIANKILLRLENTTQKGIVYSIQNYKYKVLPDSIIEYLNPKTLEREYYWKARVNFSNKFKKINYKNMIK